MADGLDDGGVGRSALQKATWRLLPLIGLGYGVAYMDRVNISFASTTMNADLGFSAAIYGLGGGLFFLSYALFEVPSNLLLVRFGARRWLARIMLTWGVIAMAMMFVREPWQFYSMRFLLGLAEAGFFPGVIFYLTQWFPAAHRGRAVSRFYIAWPLSSVIMGALAGTLLGLNGTLGLAGWQWLFLVEGMPSVVMAFVFIFLLPDRPATARWLTPAEKAWIAARLAEEAEQHRPLGAYDARPGHNIFAALAHPGVVKLAVINFIVLGAFYAFTLTAPAYLGAATHMDVGNVGYLTAIGGLAGAAAMIGNAWHSDLTGERWLHVAIPLALMAVAFGVLAISPPPPVVMAAYVVATAANAAIGGVFWSASSELIGPVRAAVSIAAINAIGQVGSFLSPYGWGIAKDSTGSFQLGISILPAFFLAGAALALILRHDAGAAIARLRNSPKLGARP
jgi:MFS transporter, ACS family, tartrate transporter